VRTSTDGASPLAQMTCRFRVAPAPAVLAQGHFPSDLRWLDMHGDAVEVDSVVGKDVSRHATGLAVPDVDID